MSIEYLNNPEIMKKEHDWFVGDLIKNHGMSILEAEKHWLNAVNMLKKIELLHK